MNQTQFPERHPYGASVLLFLAAIIIFLAAGAIVALLELPPAALTSTPVGRQTSGRPPVAACAVTALRAGAVGSRR